jgi:amino acid adenylation domain-containing protein
MNEQPRTNIDLSEKRRRLLQALMRESNGKAPDLNRIERRTDRESAPLSCAQDRLWFLNQYYPDSPIYNMSTQIPLVGPANIPAVGQVLNEIVNRHEALRTTFRTENYKPLQVIAPRLHIEVPLHDLTGMSDQERQAAGLEIIRLETSHIFDLSTGPLLRATLIRFSDQLHYLIITMHHIVSDGWSMNVLSREFSVLYDAFAAGRPSPLPPLPVHYADFSVWQRAWLEREGLKAQMPYWQSQLADVASTIIDLPADRPRPLALSFRGSTIYFTLAARLSESLRALSREVGATPFMTLLSGFKALLYRYTGQTALVVGFPTAGRNRTELEGLIGFFVNSLPLRTEVSGDQSFRELIARVKDVTLGALAHQDLPFEKMVEELQVPRMLNANPVFQIMFDLHTPSPAPRESNFSAPDEETRVAAAQGNGTSKFDLSLSMLNDGVRFSGSLEYSSDLFDEATIIRLIGHLETLLKGAVANPDLAIRHLPLLTNEERRRQLNDFNDTAEAFPTHLCLHQAFELQAHRTPDAPAAVHRDTILTYAELNRRANRLARLLRDAGVGPEDIVGICMEGSIELVVAILGVLKAGGAYLPLDATYPRERLSFMVKDAGVDLILVDDRLRARVESLAPHAVVLGGTDDPTRDHDDTDLPSLSVPGNAAYVIYTSGSTGRPKGVVVPHPGVVNMLLNMARMLEIGPGSRVLHFNSFSFDISVFELFIPLITGGALYLERREAMTFGEPLIRVLRENAITTVTLSPPAWAHLPSTSFPDLRRAVSGGAACPASVVSRWAPGRAFFNAYGPTETTVASSAVRCFADGTKPTIGKPFSNMRYYVVDRHLELVPVGVPGELLIGGIGLARGYLRQPGMTAERFIPDPFNGSPGERLYRTGDLVRQLLNGEIDFLGRIDDQVEIRGFRVELGEIEAILQSAPGIGDVTAVCQADHAGNKRIVAYVVARDQTAPATPESAREYLAERLPEYMMPATIVFLDHIPLTPAGKVDRRALPSPDALLRQRAYRAPRFPLERVVTDVLAECLQISALGIDDNFFEVGGHSLLATQVVSRLRDIFKVDLPVRVVFEMPTAAQLSAFLLNAPDREDRERAATLFQQISAMGDNEVDALLASEVELPVTEAGEAAVAPIQPARDTSISGRIPVRADWGPAPLSFAQERLWFLNQYSPESPAYNTLAPLPLLEPINVAALQHSLTEMVRRHEVLRTTFRVIDGTPMQIVAAEGVAPLIVKDYRNLPAEEGRAAGMAFIKAEALRPFDLERGPLLRVLLMRPAASPSLLVVMMHHVISDAWSQRIFFNDLITIYQAYCLGKPSPLPPLPVQYADFAQWQREMLQGAPLREKLTYWTRQLSDAPAFLELPTDRPRPLTDLLTSAMVPITFPTDLVTALHRLGRDEGTTTFMTVLAAFMVLLHRYTGHDRIPVGSPIANRDRTEIEGVIGFFTNTLVLCGDLTGEPSFRTFLRRVREMTIGSFANQDLPFEKLVEAINPPRSHQVNPLFQVMFVLQKETGTFVLPTADVSPGWGEGGDDAERQAGSIAKFDLMMYLEEGSAELYGGIEYAIDLFDHSTIERLGRHFCNLLHAIVADPDTKIGSLSLISPEEHQLLIGEWAKGPLAPDTSERNVLDQLAVQRVRAPDAPAIRSEAGSLSYRELDEAADDLAHRLVSAGVQPDDPVGVALERGPSLMVALLAVMKAGGAFLTLDPGLPAERLAFILADAAPAAVITDSAVLARQLPIGSIPRVLVDQTGDGAPGDDALASRRQAQPRAVTGPDQAAYIVYTSGSTGKPKGVVVPHRVLADLIAWQCASSELPAGSRTLQSSSPSFDVFVQEAFATWCAGGELVCLRDDDRRDAAIIAHRVAEHGIHRVFLPYVALQQIAEALTDDPSARSDLALREIVTAGEQLILTPQIIALLASNPESVLINQYGPSETHVVSQQILSGNPAEWPSLPPIGRPAADARLYVLDSRLEPVPPGAVGELFIGGTAVGRGYLGRPALTAQHMLPDPFSGIPGARMYRTGDLARHRTDGSIDFLGRRDGQVKIRGFRVELGEIEATLLNQPQVSEAVAIVQAGPHANAKRLVAYVVPAAGAEIDTATLRDALRRKLPDYMIPSRITPLEMLPLTATGKLDRLRLQMSAQADSRPDLVQQYVAPRGALETKLAALWAEVLGVVDPGINDNFFELGGHSLLGTQLVSRIRSSFGIDLPLRSLFDAPTIAGLALEILKIKAAAQAHDPRVMALLTELEQTSEP